MGSSPYPPPGRSLFLSSSVPFNGMLVGVAPLYPLLRTFMTLLCMPAGKILSADKQKISSTGQTVELLKDGYAALNTPITPGQVVQMDFTVKPLKDGSANYYTHFSIGITKLPIQIFQSTFVMNGIGKTGLHGTASTEHTDGPNLKDSERIT